MVKIRGFLATAITMTLILSPSMAAAASTDGNEKPTTEPSKTDTGTTVPADGGTKETRAPSEVENELLQLREALGAERVALDAQQIRIAELEAQIHISEVEPVIFASGSTAVTAAVSAASQPVADVVSSTPPQSGGSEDNQKKSPLSFKLGQADFTPGGWADLTGIFRGTDIGSGTGTSFASIPFNNTLPQAALSWKVAAIFRFSGCEVECSS